MDLKVIALIVAVVAAIAVGVRAARAVVGDDPATVPETDDLAAARAAAGGADESPVVVPAPSEKALRYYRGGNVIWAVEQFLGLALPALFLFAGFSAQLRTFASSLARGRFYPTLLIYLVLFSLLIGGGLMDPESTSEAFRDRYLHIVRDTARPHLWPVQRERITILPSTLGELSQAIGAALVALYRSRR